MYKEKHRIGDNKVVIEYEYEIEDYWNTGYIGYIKRFSLNKFLLFKYWKLEEIEYIHCLDSEECVRNLINKLFIKWFDITYFSIIKNKI